MSAGAPSLGELLGGWDLAAPPLAALAAAAVAYVIGVRRVRRWPPGRTAAFLAGLAVLALALASGIDAHADRLLSVHMGQHLLLTLVAPPLLMAGAPVSLALRAARPPLRRRLAGALRSRPAHVLAHPAAGWLAFTAVLLVAHLTPVFELAVRHPLVHAAEHAAFAGSALLFWAPLVGADPLPARVGAAGRLAWLLASMPPMGLVSAWLLTGPLRYADYAATSVDPLGDQRGAATLMWVGGSLLMAVAALALVCAALLAEERRQQRREALGAA